MSLTEEILSQLPGDVLGGLRRTDSILASLRTGNAPIPNVVKENPKNLESVEFDVIICGGTLGILIGCALAVRGVGVALLERGILRGREQEWNISRKELEVFRELELLTADELTQAIVTEFPCFLGHTVEHTFCTTCSSSPYMGLVLQMNRNF